MTIDSKSVKTAAPYLAIAVVIVVLLAWTWNRVASVGGSEHAGFNVLCTNATCGYQFVIPRDEARTYPRGSNREGFKCKKCGKFGALMAVQCKKCNRWYVPAEREGAASCPYCTPPATAPANTKDSPRGH